MTLGDAAVGSTVIIAKIDGDPKQMGIYPQSHFFVE